MVSWPFVTARGSWPTVVSTSRRAVEAATRAVARLDDGRAQVAVEPLDGVAFVAPLGTGKTFPATQPADRIIGAAYYDEQRGTQLERCADDGCGQNVGWITPGDQLAYAAVDSPLGRLVAVATSESETEERSERPASRA